MVAAEHIIGALRRTREPVIVLRGRGRKETPLRICRVSVEEVGHGEEEDVKAREEEDVKSREEGDVKDREVLPWRMCQSLFQARARAAP